MEKYKFRGKSLNTGEWVYGSLLQINGMSFIHPSETGGLDDCINFGWSFIEVLKESVGQFIDQIDKNEVEIYVGDRVKVVRQNYPDTVCEVKKQKGCTVFRGIGFVTDPSFRHTSLEVIGNTIDNPELLNA